MATIYSDSRWNAETKRTGWRIRVDYSGTTANVYVDVVTDYATGSSIWLKFTASGNTFTKSATTYYSKNNGTNTNLLGTITDLDPYDTRTITQICSGSTWGGNINGSSSVTIPIQQYYPPTVTASVSNVTSSSATFTATMLDDPYYHWRIHIYDASGTWRNYTNDVNVPISFTHTGLAHNTGYSFSYRYSNESDGEISDPYYYSFTTLGDAPSITSVVPSPSRTTCDLGNNSIWYDTNASLSSVSVRYGTTQSYGSTSASTYLSGLSANTTYYYSMTVTDNWGRTSGAYTGSFTTTGNAPTINGVTLTTRDRTSLAFSVTDSFDNTSFARYNISYGTTGSYGTNVTDSTHGGFTLSNLIPNTYYYLSVTVTDVMGRTSGAYTLDLINTAYAVPAIDIDTYELGENDITFHLNITNNTDNLPISKLGYVSFDNGSTWSSPVTISGNTYVYTPAAGYKDYDLYFKFEQYSTPVTGSSVLDSSVEGGPYYTILPNPTISSFEESNVTPFTCDVTAVASINPLRTLQYAFSNDNGTTWTNYQNSGIYHWTGLNEETTYYMGVKVKAIAQSSSGYDPENTMIIAVITPADQAKARIKNNNSWEKGKVYFKDNGEWKKAKKIYIKVNGQWKVQSND